MGNSISKPAYFVWRDKNVYNTFNGSIFDDGKEDISCVTSASKAISEIKEHRNSRTVYVITNGGDNAQEFVSQVRNVLNIRTELVVFCNAVDYHKTWAKNYSNVSVFSGSNNLKQWVDRKRQMHRSSVNNASAESKEDEKDSNYSSISRTPDFYTRSITGYYDIYSKNSIHYVNEHALKENLFKIKNANDLKLEYKIKSKALRDSSGYGKIPLTPRPVLSLTLNVSYSQWTESYQNIFLENLAKELGVRKSELTLIASHRGSIHAGVIINALQTQYGNTPISIGYIEEKRQTLKYSENMKKYKIESTKIESWFDETEKKRNEKSYEGLNSPTYYHLPKTLTKTERWLLHQTKSLRIGLQTALSKLKKEFIVDSICILDNDEALRQFITHPNIGQSKLLFHGTDKPGNGVLQSIFKTGLRHNGGSVYGHGSYVTSSPYHSINYQILHKKGYYQTSDTFTLIAAYVNCGRIRHIYDRSYGGKHIQYPYDSHYIAKVASAANESVLGYPLTNGSVDTPYRKIHGYQGEVADEYAIREKTRILPRFFITLRKSDHNRVVVWRDKNIHTPPKEAMINELVKYKVSVYPAMTSVEAMKIINVKKHENDVIAVTSSTDSAESFAKQVLKATEFNKGMETGGLKNEDQTGDTKQLKVIVFAKKEQASWVENYENVSNVENRGYLMCMILWWALALTLNLSAINCAIL